MRLFFTFNYRNKYIFFLIGIFITSQFGIAQDALKMNVDNLSFEKESNDNVSIATKNVQSITEAPGIISLISNSDIDKYDWTSINDAVSRLPGFSLNRDFERTVISSRGVFENWYNNHILLLIDGIPFNDNIFGSAFTSEITPLNFTRSIEVIRGTGSALYGSNAMNGVIGLQTISPNDMDKNIEIKYRGDGSTNNLDILTSGRTALVDFIVGFNYYETNGMNYSSYDGSYRKDSLGNLLKLKYNDERQSNYLFLKLEGKEKLKGFSLQFHNQSWRYNTGLGIINLVPDQPENMLESFTNAILKYNTPSITDKLQQEYVIAYKRHKIDWNIRFLPVVDSITELNEFFNYHPFGVNEMVNSYANNIFARGQIKYLFNDKTSILLGAENSVFIYNGDKYHLSNINLVNEDNNPNNSFLDQGTWMPFIKNHPVYNTSIFAQYISPKLFSGKVQITLGLRYDGEFFNFSSIDKPDILSNIESRKFQHVSPRFALVFMPLSKLTIKALVGNAFRTPSPDELFTYTNTWTTTSYNVNEVNVRDLQPEYVTTYEAQFCYQISKNYNFSTNFFRTDFQNQITYNSSLINTFNFTDIGFEAELNVNYDNLSIFLNYMFVKRIKETLLNDTIDLAVNKITWTPSQLANFGIAYQFKKLMVSYNIQYRGDILRRPEDNTYNTVGDLSIYRPVIIPQTFRHSMKISYFWSRNITTSLFIDNIFNTTSYLAKSWSYPFDYLMEARSIRFETSLKF